MRKRYNDVDEMLVDAPCEQVVVLGGQSYTLRVETFLAQWPKHVRARGLVDGLDLGLSVVGNFLTSKNRTD